MSLTTVSALLTAPKQDLAVSKNNALPMSAGQYQSCWGRGGGSPPSGVDPSSGVAGNTVDDTVTGVFPLVAAASGKTYVARIAMSHTVGGLLYLYDRLWHNSGLSATSTAGQTVNSVTLPARCPVATDPTGETFDTLGYMVEAWWECYATMGAGAGVHTVTYTNEANVGSRTGTMTPPYVTASTICRTYPFDLQAGDKGVRSIQTYTNTVSMTSGTFGLVLRRRIATIPLPIGAVPYTFDWSSLSLPCIPDDAALELLFSPSTNGAGNLGGTITLAQD